MTSIEIQYNFFMDLVNKVNDIIVLHGPSGNILDINDFAVNKLGYKKDELLCMNIDQVFSCIDTHSSKHITNENFQKLISGNRDSLNFELVYRSNDGREMPVNIKSTCVEYNNYPTILSIASYAEDNNQPEESDDTELLLDNIDNLVWYFMDKWTFGNVNQAFADFFGVEKVDVQNANIFEVVNKEEAESCVYENELIFENKEKIQTEKWFNKPDGEYRLLSLVKTPKLDNHGEAEYIVCSAVDITTTRQYEEQLKESEEQFREITENMLDMVSVTDINGYFEYAGPSHEWVLGYKPRELIGKHVFDFVYPEDMERLLFEYQNFLETLEVKIVEYRYLHADGHYVWLETAGNVIFDDSGNVKRIVFGSRDITKRKHAECKIQEYASKLEKINETQEMFTDILRHDLLNPIGIVKGYSQLLCTKETDGDKLELLDKIISSTDKSIELIENAGNLAKIENMEKIEFQSMNIVGIIEQVINDYQTKLDENRIFIDFVNPGNCYSRVNPIISQAFSNLINNAIKFSPFESTIKLNFLDNGAYWKFMVVDSGPGIPDDEKPYVFNRFKSNNKSVSGSGLGLSIVKEIIELHGGEVGVEDNQKGSGAAFWLTLKKEK